MNCILPQWQNDRVEVSYQLWNNQQHEEQVELSMQQYGERERRGLVVA